VARGRTTTTTTTATTTAAAAAASQLTSITASSCTTEGEEARARGASPITDSCAARALLDGYASTLGRLIEQRWAARRNHVAAFPEVTTQALADVDIPEALDPATILAAAATGGLPQQEDPQSDFGRPPLTVYRSREFFVSTLFWFDGTTTIHQHGFSGAFRVLAGGSLHASYRFQPSDEVTHRLAFGALELEKPELLRVGMVRSIEPGDRFIHGLFHLERPSVTVVVRTYSQPTGQPQFNYLRPGLAYDPFYRHHGLQRRLQSLSALADFDRPAALTAADEVIRSEDLWTAFLLLQHWFSTVERTGSFDQLLELVEHRHGTVAAFLRVVFEHEQRARSIAARRQLVHDDQHRLFLALLLNLPDRQSIDDVLRQRFPTEVPGELLARWVVELAAPERRGLSGLSLQPDALAHLTAALRDGAEDALTRVGTPTPPPTMLRDLFPR